MIELVFGIIILGFLYAYGIKISNEMQRKEDRDLALKQIVEIIDKFIFNPNGGYTSDKGGFCSEDFSVRDISAYRIQQCAGIPGFSVVELESTDEARKDGKKSYFSLLKQHDEGSNEALRIYIDDEDDYEIKVLFMSAVEERGKIEQYIGSLSQNELRSRFQRAYYEAESMDDTNYNGSPTDGIIRVHFKN